jgi:hypothetical protein
MRKRTSQLTSKVDDKQPNHADSGPTSCRMRIELIDVLGEDNSDDEMAKTHTNGTDSQNRLTTETINPENGRNGSDKHDNTDNSSSQQTGSVAAET